MIYITEAHATDVWNIGESAYMLNKSHKKIEDRIDCANRFIKLYDFQMPIYCDNMNNEFEAKYAAWPFRYYVVQNNKLINIGQPNDSYFELTELFDFLKKL